MNEEKFKRNENGIDIKVCCASCKRKKITDEEGRFCMLTQVQVCARYGCDKWEMHQRLQNAGMGIGKVKSSKYLSYYRERYLELREALAEGRIGAAQMKSTVEIRKEYEDTYGNVFVEM